MLFSLTNPEVAIMMMGIFLFAAFPDSDVLPATPADTLTHEPKDDLLSVEPNLEPVKPAEPVGVND